MLSILNVAISELVFVVCLGLFGGELFEINITLCEDLSVIKHTCTCTTACTVEREVC